MSVLGDVYEVKNKLHGDSPVTTHQRLIRFADFVEIWFEFFSKICQGSVSVLKFG
jgi:hypothetical protein